MEDSNNNSIINELCDLIKSKPLGSVLFVVGAGASNEAGVKLSSDLKKEIRHGYDDLIDQMLREKGIIDFEDAPFELIMSLYNQIHDEEAGFKFLKASIPNIEEAYTKNILLAYEVIAHMFYFGITNHIISLNFDELLERALHDEVGRRGYSRIHSRSAFEKLIDINLSGPVQKYLYKPHGTISYKMTLRHTWDNVVKLDKEKRAVLSRVISQSPIIIAVGYGFNDRDVRPLIMSSIMNKIDGEDKSLYIITKTDTKGNYSKAISEIDNMIKATTINAKIIDCGSEDFFTRLPKILFDVEYDNKYPGIDKHRARHLIFNKLIDEKQSTIIKDLTDKIGGGTKIKNKEMNQLIHLHVRLIVDIALFIASLKGKFKSNVILESSRIMRYLKELKEYINNILILDDSKHGTKSQGDIYENFTINAALNQFNKMFIIEKTGRNKTDEMVLFKTPKEAGKRYEEYLAEELLHSLQINSDNSEYREIINLLIAITKKIDISLVQETTHIVRFRRPFIIDNFDSLTYLTNNILENSKEIKIIAETGEWIKRVFGKNFNAQKYKFNQIEIIVSDYTPKYGDDSYSFHTKRATEIYTYLNVYLREQLRKNKRTLKLRRYKNADMPHHMTIGDNEAIYFYRDGRSISICPMLLRNSHDLTLLNELFTSCWIQR